MILMPYMDEEVKVHWKIRNELQEVRKRLVFKKFNIPKHNTHKKENLKQTNQWKSIYYA